MATTVIAYFHSYDEALQVLEDLVANDYDAELVKLAYEPTNRQSAPVDYDNTIEQAPVIEFKDATFGAELTEEDAIHYADCLSKGDALLTVHIPTDPTQERDWESQTARTIEDFLADGGAYDHEIRKIYSNRAGLTTYPQNRYSDPIGPNKINKDRIYESRSPLNGEVSNVIGVPDNSNYLDELTEQSGRRVLTASEVLALLKR
jgi:hypothetical protein